MIRNRKIKRITLIISLVLTIMCITGCNEDSEQSIKNISSQAESNTNNDKKSNDEKESNNEFSNEFTDNPIVMGSVVKVDNNAILITKINTKPDEEYGSVMATDSAEEERIEIDSNIKVLVKKVIEGKSGQGEVSSTSKGSISDIKQGSQIGVDGIEKDGKIVAKTIEVYVLD